VLSHSSMRWLSYPHSPADLAEMEKAVRTIEMEGLHWGAGT
jgi:hypothetical protein